MHEVWIEGGLRGGGWDEVFSSALFFLVCWANVCVWSVLLCVHCQFKSCHSDEASNLLHDYCGADNYIYLSDTFQIDLQQGFLTIWA